MYLFFLIQKLFSPKRCNKIASPRLRGRFFKRLFLGRSNPSLAGGFFMLKGLILCHHPPKKTHYSGVLFFQSPRLSCKPPVPQKMHVQPGSTQPDFLGMPGADWLLAATVRELNLGSWGGPMRQSSGESTFFYQRGIIRFSISSYILNENTISVSFYPKKIEGLGRNLLGFPRIGPKIVFLGNFKISKFQNITCWVAYFWAVATTPRAPYRVPRRKLMFERPVDLKEAAESGRCVEDELDFQEEKTDFVIKVLICK